MPARSSSLPLWMPELDEDWERRHRVHDVKDVVRRWRAVARAARMSCDVLATAGGHPVLCLRSRRLTDGALYLSSGVHGDEPAAVQGLLVWCEENAGRLRDGNVIVFPLLNPVGLALNTRADGDGRDLNRSFHDASCPVVAAWLKSMAGVEVGLSVCLHEDYDSLGTYGYELNRNPRLHLMERFLAAAAAVIPPDPRGNIEGARARLGVIRRKRVPRLDGLPEAVVLYQSHTARTVTLETPSEFALALRVRVHARWVEEAWILHEELS